jgi:cytidylate kinase
MIKVLTVEREYGSGASDIAQELADKLGWKLWDQLLTNEIARHMECDKQHVEHQEERRDPLHYRLFKSFLRGSFEGSMNIPRMKMADAEGIRRVSEQLVMEAAEGGNAVIVGRGAAYYLHDRPDCFHILIYAPLEERVRRLQLAGKSKDEATQLAETVDKERAAFIQECFKIKWPDRHYFNLMVNSTAGDAVVVRTVLDGLKAMDGLKATEER